jgi:dipeptidyl aminopeptidase/acylaminoacyl peptidase
LIRAVKLLLLTVALALLAPGAAHAALPGDDGDIAFTSAFCCDDAFSAPDNDLLRVSPAGGREPRPLVPDAAQPAWAPDGKRLAYRSRGELFTARADGGHRRPVRKGDGLSQPSWSPGGRWLAAIDAGTLLIVRPDGSGLRYPDAPDFPAEDPSWGVNGLLAYTVIAEGGGKLIGIIKASGGGGRVITDGSNPDWSPSGRSLAFERQGGIHVSDARGRRTRIVAERGTDPAWAPSGDRVIYVNRRGDLVSVGSDGHGRHTVVEAPESWIEDPAWQPLRR